MHAMTTEPCGCVDWGSAFVATDALLRDAYRIDVRKALDPLDQDDFLVIVEALSQEIRALAEPIEAPVIEAMLAGLDLDWAVLTDAQRAEAVHAANLAMRGLPAQVLPRVTPKMSEGVVDMVRSTKLSAGAALAIETTFDAVDEQVAMSLASLGQWITDEYGRRASMLATGASKTIANGLAQGLRSKDITNDLHALGKRIGVKRGADYWRLVALNASNRARSYGHLRTMNDAGVTTWLFSAVMDERTSAICRALDGTVFPVQNSLARFSDLSLETQGDFTAAEKVMPFVRERVNDSGEIDLFVEQPGGARTLLGVVADRGLGRADYRPPVRSMLSPGDLQAAGVSVPPLHQACRSAILPDV